MRRPFALTLMFALAVPAAVAAAGPSGEYSPSEARLHESLGGAAGSLSLVDDVAVRRWEYVLLVRTSPEVPDAIGRAEVAAFRAGGAVLEGIREDYTASHSDYKLLVRTRDENVVQDVLKAVRATRGVLGASSSTLPETPTYPGGPGFFESYVAPTDGRPSNADRVVMRHDIPPIADKRELLEMSDVLSPPSMGPAGAGGFTMNVSELYSRMKEGAWRKREDRLRNTPIDILPPAPSEDGAAATP